MSEESTLALPFTWPSREIEELCQRWKIVELADLLVRFAPDARWSLFDHMGMELELVALLGREVDLVSRSSVERSPNWIRREEILGTARTLYAA